VDGRIRRGLNKRPGMSIMYLGQVGQLAGQWCMVQVSLVGQVLVVCIVLLTELYALQTLQKLVSHGEQAGFP